LLGAAAQLIGLRTPGRKRGCSMSPALVQNPICARASNLLNSVEEL